MKTTYDTPTMELTVFANEDIITTSGLKDLLVEEDTGNWGKLN